MATPQKANRDVNRVPGLMGAASDGSASPVEILADPITGRLYVTATISNNVSLNNEALNHENDSTYDYFAFAPAGSDITQALWRVFRMNKSTYRIQYANGSTSYTNVGSSMSSLTYV